MTRSTKTTAHALAALLATTALAQAGGIERNGFTTGILFEEGNYVELGYTFVDPDVSGALNPPLPATASGDMSAAYGYFQFSYHNDLSDGLSISVVIDEPVGADVAYPGPGGAFPGTYAFALSTAELNSQQITVAGRYEINDAISVYAGLRAVQVDGSIFVSTPTFSYALGADSDTGFGYMVGAAYEIPDIALRVALTYFSEVDLSLTGAQGVAGPGLVPPPTVLPAAFEITLPDSVLLEAQTGVAEGTLVFGSIRWVDWSEFDITPGAYPPGALVSYENDTFTFTLGGARRLNENLAVLASASYEADQGGFASNLGPTDGRFGVGIGARYTLDQWELSGGLNYTWVGSADTSLGAPLTATFRDNYAVGAGVRIGYRF